MATAAGDLIVRLNAQTRGFNRKMSGAGRTLGMLSGIARGATGRLLGLSAGLIGVGSAAAVLMKIKQQMSAIDTVAKLSDQLGIATEKLIGLRHAAEITGAGSKTLDAALGTLSKRLGESARRGSGPAKEALDELGLSVERLAGMNAGFAFEEIAGAMERIESPIKRNAIAANLFSKANMTLVNTLALGKKGLQAMQQDAEKLGLTFSRESAAGVEAANDAIHRFGQSTTAVFTQAAIQLAPFIKLLADDLTGAAVGANAKIGEMKTGTGSLADEFGVLGAGIINVVERLQEYQKKLHATLIVGLKFTAWVHENFPATQKIALAVQGVPTDEIAAQFEKDKAAIANQIKSMENSLAAMETATDWSLKLRDRLRESRAELEAMRKVPGPELPGGVPGLRGSGGVPGLPGLPGTDGASLPPIGGAVPTAQPAEDLVKRFQQQIDFAGMSPRETQVATVAANTKEFDLGANLAAEAAMTLAKRLDQLDAGKRLRESLETPLEEARRRIEEVGNLFKADIIGETTRDRAVEQIEQRAASAEPSRSVAANLKGTQGAWSTIMAAMRNAGHLRKIRERNEAINQKVQPKPPQPGQPLQPKPPQAPDKRLPNAAVAEKNVAANQATAKATAQIADGIDELVNREPQVTDIPPA